MQVGDNPYVAGMIAVLTGTYSDDTNALITPTTAIVKYAVRATPNGTPTITTLTWTTGGPTTPAVGELAEVSTGVFVAQVSTTGLPGYWTYEFLSTGVGQTMSPPGSFYVAPPGI